MLSVGDRANRLAVHFAIAVLLCFHFPGCKVSAQATAIKSESSIEIWVLDTTHQPVKDATVTVEPGKPASSINKNTDVQGLSTFLSLPGGTYSIVAHKAGQGSGPPTLLTLASGEHKQLRLVLGTIDANQPGSKSAGMSAEAMQFADQPNFTIAGVTDWTAVGGHGADTSLRASEALTRQTVALKSASPPITELHNAPDTHHLAGDLAEKSGDSLSAIREYEKAARINPSEENYFAWGSELLLHRAILQAQQVFQSGTAAFPTSTRLITGLGTALFAGGLYDDAAVQLCRAADLNPQDPTPYLSLGKIELAAPKPLACVEQKLADFVHRQPDHALGNYYYAMTLLKADGNDAAPQAESLLTRAVTLDPGCGDGYLQLGILAFARHEVPQAVDLYSKAIQADPDLGEAHYRLGVAYDRMGESGKARLEFKQHDQIEARQAAEVERQRRELKQFLVVVQGQPAPPAAH